VFERMRRGVEPPMQGFGGNAPEMFFFFCIETTFFRTALYLGGFLAHGFFADGFLFTFGTHVSTS
jgi:hypothetical protein